MVYSAYLALGSNIGDRETYLQKAVDALSEMREIEVLAVSSLYETEPVGYLNQDPFLNMAIHIKTTLRPYDLLRETQRIEMALGRERDVRFGPRTVDIDILLFEQENMEMDDLQIPHPRMWERAFVLIPLAEIAPEIYSEAYGKTLNELCEEQLIDKEGVKWWSQWNGAGVYVRSEN
ncbi:2-amino-4-hydroxy-6-hydroxymethyldihydropteridine diphosphokinase [Shouchella patagoniensis]|uniref:2-amino-4-hydroxy-6- hydroxymethyldihydropteridine diphosphokinase n=1 Tax=Shouchella patagoniensis TaxID=228576 RepID=UPI00099566F4|nr:2-amino-4-hydroxy-6-hydroxymethyldihydropteridine diphosphokinase [Shouchella patagoniensis]